MKKILTVIIAFCMLSACKRNSFLDDKSNNALNEESVFSDSVRSMSFLTRIYSDEGFAFNKLRYENGGVEQSTDDSEYTLLNTARRPLILYTSSYNADNTTVFDAWQLPYDNIRRCNLFLSKLPVVPFKEATKTRTAAEARFLRAWYYFNLIINFGGIPIVKEQVFGLTDEVNIPRSTFEESVNYVVKELDDAAKTLPVNYTGNDYGRVTKGAALAVKARLLLYAASPLFNGNTWPAPASPERNAVAGYPSFNVTRWQTAANAAKDVMDMNVYSLNVDNTTAPGYGFYSVFLKRINSEYIFYHNRAPNREFESFYLPASRGSGGRFGPPTQNLVDAFPMNNGKAIRETGSGYKDQDPYTGREPRFGYSIIFNGAQYWNQATGVKAPVFTFQGTGQTADAFVQSTTSAGPSGYYSRKMLDENLNAAGPGNTDRGWPLIRYADILLMYAEAINETGQTNLSYPVLQQIRNRAGILPGTDGLYGIKANMTQVEMRDFVRNERRVELMFENQRWDDVRRWKLAITVFNGYNKLMKPTKVAVSTTYPTGYQYEVVNSLFLHTFNERNYLLPITTSEILKAPAMIQNPGW